MRTLLWILILVLLVPVLLLVAIAAGPAAWAIAGLVATAAVVVWAERGVLRRGRDTRLPRYHG